MRIEAQLKSADMVEFIDVPANPGSFSFERGAAASYVRFGGKE